MKMGEHLKMRELLERALAIEERHYGSEHVQVALTLNSLGNAYGALGDHEKAKAVLQRALRLMEAHYGHQQHPRVAMVMRNLSRELCSAGRCRHCAAFARASTRHTYRCGAKLMVAGTSDYASHESSLDAFLKRQRQQC